MNQLKKNTLTILGSGTSTGIPMVGCDCNVCSSNDPKDQRTRTSALLQTKNGTNIIIDTGPDFRYQCLKNKINRVDGVIITHDHADHCHGIDDLRPFCFRPKLHHIPIFTSSVCGENLKNRFSYIFAPHKPDITQGGGIPMLKLNKIDFSAPCNLTFDIFANNTQNLITEEFYFFELPHGRGHSMGIYYQGMAYLVDCQQIPGQVVDKLKSLGVDTLIIDCVREKPHSTHLHSTLAFEYIKTLSPKTAALIHMNHDLSHQKLQKKCSQANDNVNICAAYDGQKLYF